MHAHPHTYTKHAHNSERGDLSSMRYWRKRSKGCTRSSTASRSSALHSEQIPQKTIRKRTTWRRYTSECYTHLCLSAWSHIFCHVFLSSSRNHQSDTCMNLRYRFVFTALCVLSCMVPYYAGCVGLLYGKQNTILIIMRDGEGYFCDDKLLKECAGLEYLDEHTVLCYSSAWQTHSTWERKTDRCYFLTIQSRLV